MVDVKVIQLFLGSLLVNEIPCINMGSSMFERNIPLRLKNVAKYHVYKMSQKREVKKLSKRGKILKRGKQILKGSKVHLSKVKKIFGPAALRFRQFLLYFTILLSSLFHNWFYLVYIKVAENTYLLNSSYDKIL